METSQLTEFIVVKRFRELEGRAYRPQKRPSQPRLAAERRRLLNLIAPFSFAPLEALFDVLGHAKPQRLRDDLGLTDQIDAHALATEIIDKLSREPLNRAQQIFKALRRLHDGLVLTRPLSAPPDLISCPGSRTLSRVVTAFRCWERFGKSASVVVSGGFASYDKDRPKAGLIREADAYAACLKLWGIPADSILMEHNASTTRENARFLHDALDSCYQRLGRPVRLLLVSTGFHTTRYALSVQRVHEGSSALGELGVEPGPSFLGETLAFDEGGQSAREKIAIVINEYLKLHWDLTREAVP